jgi:GntR family transcriptional regulator, transcriptional repressor for pyruvate dehydrogenase complex
MFTPVRSRRSFEEALDQIVEAIVTGTLKVGERMPSEREMATEMGISRPTLREALKILSDAGIVAVQRRSGGTYVQSDEIPTELLAERRSVLLDEVPAVLQARRILETNIALIAGQVATQEELDALAKTIELQREHADDHDRMLQIDKRFHLQLARASHNPMLLDLLRAILRRSAVARDMTPRAPGDAELETAIHERTLEAIASRDPRRIEQAMDEHMSYLENIWDQETGAKRGNHV